MMFNLSILLLALNRSNVTCNRPSPPPQEHCFKGMGVTFGYASLIVFYLLFFFFVEDTMPSILLLF